MRRTNIGGQAVIEGVMMRGKNVYALAVRNLDNEIEIDEQEIKPLSEKYPFFKWPIIRGMVAFVSSMSMGMEIMNKSIEMSGIAEEEEEPSKFEKFLEEKFGENLNKIVMAISSVFALALGVGLFMVLPTFIVSLINNKSGTSPFMTSLLEGTIRLVIFSVYIFLISKNKDIQRVLMYHGAEHKTINCYEHEDELTVENVKKRSRLHKRCGTSFLFLFMFISIILFMFVKTDVVLYRVLSRILFIPLIAGISYEVLKWAGANDNIIVDIVSYPGMMFQKLTTKEPDDGQIEVAIAAMTTVLEEEGEK